MHSFSITAYPVQGYGETLSQETQGHPGWDAGIAYINFVYGKWHQGPEKNEWL